MNEAVHINSDTRLGSSQSLGIVNNTVQDILDTQNIQRNQDASYYLKFITSFPTAIKIYNTYVKASTNVQSEREKHIFTRDIIRRVPEFKDLSFSPWRLDKLLTGIYETGTVDDERARFILKSMHYICKNDMHTDDVDLNNYDYTPRECSWGEIGKIGQEIFAEYKQNVDLANPYMPHLHQGPFSMIDQDTEVDINGRQGRGTKINTGNQRFFTVHNDRGNMDVQLLVNQLFAPFLPMTRLLKLKNEKESMVSIDVADQSASGILGGNEHADPTIKNFLRIIYQFIAQDYDRSGPRNRYEMNIKNGIIFDFGMMQNKARFHSPNVDSTTFRKINLYIDEFAKLLFFFQVYIEKMSSGALNELSPDMIEEKEFWEMIQDRVKMLNMTNIMAGMDIDYGNKLQAPQKIDKAVKQMHKG